MGGIGSVTNNIATQKIINKCDNVDLKQAGKAFATGVGVGLLGGVGTAIGSNIVKMYGDELIVGGSPVINYGNAGGLIGDTIGTIITNQTNQRE